MAENRATIIQIEHSPESHERVWNNGFAITTVSRVINTHFKKDITECDAEFLKELEDIFCNMSDDASYRTLVIKKNKKHGRLSLKWIKSVCPEQYHACLLYDGEIKTELILSYAADMWET